MKSKRIEISLGGSGMTSFHRAGLAGLYMTLDELAKDNRVEKELNDAGGKWKLYNDKVTIDWNQNPEFFEKLIEESFKIKENDDLVWFRAFGKPSRNGAAAALNECLLGTLLQHGRTRKSDPSNKPSGSYVEEIDGKEVPGKYHKITAYQHQNEKISEPHYINSVLYPGGSVRHSAFDGTGIAESIERYISLLYAIIGVFYFFIRRKGKWEGSQYALVIPEIKNLHEYKKIRKEYAEKRINELTVSGEGEAALRVEISRNAYRTMERFKSNTCRVISFGKVPWNKQQKVRTHVYDFVTKKIEDINDIRVYKHCLQVLPPRLVDKDTNERYWIYPQIPELIARNILEGHSWWNGFAEFISDKEIGDKILGISKNVLYSGEREGIAKIVGSSKDESFSEAERVFVNACHETWRKKLGILGQRARDEHIDFNDLVRKEFVKNRVSFLQCKNAQTFRETITAFWTQTGGSISSLQEGWKDILLLISSDWKIGRDLALLSLASYRGTTI